MVIEFGPIEPLVLILVSKNQIKFGFNFGSSFRIGIKIEINFFQFIKYFWEMLLELRVNWKLNIGSRPNYMELD